jgi:hypothetical protein
MRRSGIVASAAALILGYGWKLGMAIYLPGGLDSKEFGDEAKFVYYVVNDFGPFIGWLGVIVSAGAFAWIGLRDKLVPAWLGVFSLLPVLAVAFMGAGMSIAGYQGIVGPVWLIVASAAIAFDHHRSPTRQRHAHRRNLRPAGPKRRPPVWPPVVGVPQDIMSGSTMAAVARVKVSAWSRTSPTIPTQLAGMLIDSHLHLAVASAHPWPTPGRTTHRRLCRALRHGLAARSGVGADDLLHHVIDACTDDVRLRTDRAEDHAGTRDEGGLTPGGECAADVP